MAGTRKRVLTLKPSRNGCRTCRIRRIKCDEARPHCKRCTSTDRQCDGYGIRLLPAGADVSSRPLQPLGNPRSGNTTSDGDLVLALVQAPSSTSLALNDTDRYAFDFFRREIAGPLSQFLPYDDWVCFVLQVALREPRLFTAIVAVGSIHIAQVGTDYGALKQPVETTQNRLAVQKYCRAVRSLNIYLEDAVCYGGSLEPVLASCLLLSQFEVIRENVEDALSHLRCGRLILLESEGSKLRSPDGKRPFLRVDSPLVTRDLVRVFDVAVGSRPNTRRFWEAPAIACSKSPVIEYDSFPLTFPSMEEARIQLDLLMEAGHEAHNELFQLAGQQVEQLRYVLPDQAVRYCVTGCLSKLMNIPSTLSARIWLLTTAYEAWSRASIGIDTSPGVYAVDHMEHTPRASSSHVIDWSDANQANDSPVQQVLLMQIQHFISHFKLATCRETEENLTDRFEDCFQGALSMAEQYLLEPSQSRTPGAVRRIPSAFGVENCILPLIYLLSVKCRSPSLRRRATSLFNNIKRDQAVKYGGSRATYAESIAKLEEQRAVALIPDSSSAQVPLQMHQIPEAARFANVVVFSKPHSARTICGRFAHERSGKMEFIEYKGTGAPLPMNLWMYTRVTEVQWRQSCQRLKLTSQDNWVPCQTS